MPSTDDPLSARSGWLRTPRHLHVLLMCLSLLATTLQGENKRMLRRKKYSAVRRTHAEPETGSELHATSLQSTQKSGYEQPKV